MQLAVVALAMLESVAGFAGVMPTPPPAATVRTSGVFATSSLERVGSSTCKRLASSYCTLLWACSVQQCWCHSEIHLRPCAWPHLG